MCLNLCVPMDCRTQASLFIINSWSLLKLMLIESVVSSNHLIFCRPLLFLPSIFLSIRGFSNESALRIRWPEYWSFSFSISPSNEYSGLISYRMDWWISLQSKGLSGVFSNTTVQKHQLKNSFESVLMRWIKLEPIIQSEVSQKDKDQYSILMHIYGI